MSKMTKCSCQKESIQGSVASREQLGIDILKSLVVNVSMKSLDCCWWIYGRAPDQSSRSEVGIIWYCVFDIRLAVRVDSLAFVGMNRCRLPLLQSTSPQIRWCGRRHQTIMADEQVGKLGWALSTCRRPLSKRIEVGNPITHIEQS